MKKREMRETTIYYCDICGNECGLPYMGMDDNGYGDCCDSKMHKARRYINALNRLRVMNRIPSIELTFNNLLAAIKKQDKAHGRELEPSGTDEIS